MKTENNYKLVRFWANGFKYKYNPNIVMPSSCYYGLNLSFKAVLTNYSEIYDELLSEVLK